MDSFILYSHPVLQCRTNRDWKQLLGPRTGKSSLIVRDVSRNCSSAFLSIRGVQFVSLSIKTNKDQDGDNSSAPLISRKEKDKLARQEEIISLFRRIQSSISKGEKKGTDDDIPEDNRKKPVAESVLEIIRQSRKKVKSKIEANQANSEKTKFNTVRKMPVPTPKKDKELEPVSNLEVPWPTSNFMKSSPIPFPLAPTGKANETGEDNRFGSQKLEGLIFDELKELAKCRGLKGYQKLKKTELVQLLLLQS